MTKKKPVKKKQAAPFLVIKTDIQLEEFGEVYFLIKEEEFRIEKHFFFLLIVIPRLAFFFHEITCLFSLYGVTRLF